MPLTFNVSTDSNSYGFTLDLVKDFDIFEAAKGFRSGYGLSKYFNRMPAPSTRESLISFCGCKPEFAFSTSIRIVRTAFKAVQIGNAYGMPGTYNKWIGMTAVVSFLGISTITPRILVITNVALTILEYRLRPCKAFISLATMSIQPLTKGTRLETPARIALNIIAIPALGLAFYAGGALTRTMIVTQMIYNFKKGATIFN